MNQRGFTNIVLVIVVVAIVGIGAYFVSTRQIMQPTSSPTPTPTPTQNNLPVVTLSSVQFPDLVIYNSDSFGGLGRLVYDEVKNEYSLVDFKFTPYLVEGTKIRPMKPKEGGGTMAVPSAIKSTKGAIFAMVPSYNTLLKLDADFSVLKQKGFDVFAHAGSPKIPSVRARR